MFRHRRIFLAETLIDALGSGGASGSWRAVFGDRPFTGFCVTHTAFTLASASKFAVLPIVVRDLLHGPQWIAGTAITLGTVVVVTAQRPIVTLLAGHSRTVGLIGAATLSAVSFALLIPVEMVSLQVAEGRASSIFQLSWGLPVALAPGLLAVLLSVSNALTWSVLALTCTAAIPALLVLRKKLPEALREPSPAVAE
jgi:hypothetical protein